MRRDIPEDQEYKEEDETTDPEGQEGKETAEGDPSNVDTQPNVNLADTDLPSARATKPQLMEKVGNIDILVFFKEYAKDPNIPYIQLQRN